MSAKLIVIWCLLMISLPVGVLWIRPDFLARQDGPALLKLSILLTAVCTCGVLSTYALERKWSSQASRFEEFLAALPAQEKELPHNASPDLDRLSHAMRAMADRIRRVVEEAKLEASRRETILACMAEGVLAVDRDLRIIFCNDAFADAFSTRIPAEGRTLYEIAREPLLREVLERVVATGTAETNRFQLPSAEGRWFETRTLPLGQPPRRGAVIVLHDVTRLHRQEQLRKDFVANVSHELRTPLAAIRGYAETLLDGALTDSRNNRAFVETILSQAIRLNNIASDLLVLSELDSQVGEPAPPERIPLLEVIDSARRTVEPVASARGIRLDTHKCRECEVIGHRFRLEQALVNLLDNAVKFNRPAGEVKVECGYTPEGQVRVSVADTGIGIPSDELNRIFERFYRVDKARSRPAGGTGLGLPIVKEVINRMHGTVSVESQLGSGSRFTILLQAA